MESTKYPPGTRVVWGEGFGTISSADGPGGQPIRGYSPEYEGVWVCFDEPVRYEDVEQTPFPNPLGGYEYRWVTRIVYGTWARVENVVLLTTPSSPPLVGNQ